MSEKTVLQPGERLFMWFLVGVSLAVVAYSFTLPLTNLSSPGIFPLLAGVVMFFCALKVLWTKRSADQGLRLRQELRAAGAMMFPRTVIVFTLILIAYILLLGPLHFLVSSFLFLVASFLFLKGTTSWLKAPIIAAGVVAGIYVVFQYIFKVVLW